MAGPWLVALAAMGIALVALLILFVAAVVIPRAPRAIRCRFYCPWRSRNVVVRYLTGDDGRPVAVLSCTAFADPLIVACEQQCVPGVRASEAPIEREPSTAA